MDISVFFLNNNNNNNNLTVYPYTYYSKLRSFCLHSAYFGSAAFIAWSMKANSMLETAVSTQHEGKGRMIESRDGSSGKL